MSFKKTKEDVQKTFDQTFGQNSYKLLDDFSGTKKKASILCNTCFLTFHKVPYYFLKSLGCPSCMSQKKSLSISRGKSKETEEDVLCLLQNKYPKHFSFSFSTPFKNRSTTLVNVLCSLHSNTFTVGVKSLLREDNSSNISCKDCLREAKTNPILFKDKLEKKFPNTFDLTSLRYANSHEDVSVVCKVCGGTTTKKAYSLLQGFGCSSCKPKSYVEVSIKNYIKTLLPEVVVKTTRPKWLEGKELDIFIPSLNLAIEYNGTAFHHSSNSNFVKPFFLKHSKNPKYHFEKWKTCFDNDVTLLSIYDFYWNIPVKQEIYKSKIRHHLGLDEKIYARKTEISEISNNIAYDFYENNHLEGKGVSYRNAKSYGIFHNNTLVMVATIGSFFNQKTQTFKTKLHRICTLKDVTVVGGISKMSSFLKKKYGTFSYQITLSSGGLSLHGCKEYKLLNPRYFWVKGNDISVFYHRNSTQKSLLEKQFKTPLLSTDTENTYMERLGYLKVFDNGLAELLF